MAKIEPIFLVGIGAVLLALGLFSGLIPSIGAMLSGQVNYCNQTPYDVDCICQTGQDKIQNMGAQVGNLFLTYSCVQHIEPPIVTISFPLTDYAQAWNYTKQKMGDLSCTGSFFLSGPPISGTIPERFNAMNIECDRGLEQENTFTVAWRFAFLRSDGSTIVKQCSQPLLDQMGLGERCPQ